VLFSFDELHRARSAAVAGRQEPGAALEALLQGTGFAARRNERGKFGITPVALPTGSVRGRLIDPGGAAARGIRVIVPAARRSALTDDNGEFEFKDLPAGTYRLVATGADLQPLQIADVRVSARETLILAPRTMRSAGDPIQLEPVFVEDRSVRSQDTTAERSLLGAWAAGGDLDLPRSQDDALPFTIYRRDQIIRSGVVDLNQYLQRELLESDAGIPEPGSGAQGLFAGSTNLNLRGFGTDETVVMVNGRRLPDILTRGANPSLSYAPDVDLIPLSLVQRIEVLPVSASALYSGNPVGGVINIVLRSDLAANSTEVTSTYTNALRGFDAPQSSVSLLHSEILLGGALRLRLSAAFTQVMPPTVAELGYHQALSVPLDSAAYGATPNIRSADRSPLFGAGTPSVTSVAPGADGSGGLAEFANRQGVRDLGLFHPPGGWSTSPDSVNYAYGARQRRSAYYGSVDYDVSPRLQIGLDASYALTVTNPGQDLLTADLSLGANSPFNPFQRDVLVSLNEAVPQLGEAYGEARAEFYSAVAGLVLKLPADWRVDLDGQYDHSLATYRGLAGADSARWQQLVDQGIYNPLRDTQVFGPPRQFYEQVLVYEGGPGRFTTFGNYGTLDLALRATDPALRLPTGAGVMNLGIDYRRDHFDDLTEAPRYGDGSPAGEPVVWTGRTLQQYSAFGELQAPLLPRTALPQWLRQAQAELAARYDAAASSRESNLAPTFGLKLGLAGGITLRGSATLSNRYPTPLLSQQAPGTAPAGGGLNTKQIFDPVRNEKYDVEYADILNPVLREEGTVTRTAGVVLERGRSRRIRAALDFVDTHKNNEVTYFDPQTVLDLEQLLPGRVTRAPLAPGDAKSAGYVTSVLTGATNIYLRHSQNCDAALDCAWTEFSGGALEVYGRLVYFMRYDRQLLPSSPVVDELRQPDGSGSNLLKYRANFGAGWSNRDCGFGLDGHYFFSRILPAVEWPSQGADRIDPFWQFDAYLQGDLGRWLPWKNSHCGLRGQVRVNNVFDSGFPAYANEASGAGVQPYGDWRGRTYSVSLTATF